MSSLETVESATRDIPSFRVGDTVVVEIKVVEGDRERAQVFEGVVIGKRGRGVNGTFTVRRISYGEGVERIFALRSPLINKIEVVKKGRVGRAKLYYLRQIKGKKGRIREAAEETVEAGATLAEERRDVEEKVSEK